MSLSRINANNEPYRSVREALLTEITFMDAPTQAALKKQFTRWFVDLDNAEYTAYNGRIEGLNKALIAAWESKIDAIFAPKHLRDSVNKLRDKIAAYRIEHNFSGLAAAIERLAKKAITPAPVQTSSYESLPIITKDKKSGGILSCLFFCCRESEENKAAKQPLLQERKLAK